MSDISPNSIRNIKYPDERKNPTTARNLLKESISFAIPFSFSKSVLPLALLKNLVLIALSCHNETRIVVLARRPSRCCYE